MSCDIGTVSGEDTASDVKGETRVFAVSVTAETAVERRFDDDVLGKGVVFVGERLTWFVTSSETFFGDAPSMIFHAGKSKTDVASGSCPSFGSGTGMLDAERNIY